MTNPLLPPTPTGAELEVLSVLWDLERTAGALKLAQMHEQVEKRRADYSAAPPALSTLATTVRNAVAKGLLREVQLTSDGVEPFIRSKVRGWLVSPRSTPKLAYQAAFAPSEVMARLLGDLASAYPADQKYQPLLDMAVALGLPADLVDRIKKMLPKT